MINKKVMVAMSGGVDSSVAAVLLKNQDYSVLGGTLRLFERDNNVAPEVELAKDVCKKLGIEHFTFDKREEFKEKIISYFSKSYENGLTPNPCIECNKHIKFGALLDEAQKLGSDYIATGHYSKIIRENSKSFIIRPEDRKKDQTYVLWRLTQEQLSHILMPLGDYTKDEVREIAEEYNFLSAKAKESQDICFVPDGDYAAFLKDFCGVSFTEGDYLDINGNCLGKHLGHQNYTVGQRKGLGIALGKPQFVISKDAATNTVVLSDEEYLFKTRVYVTDVNIMSGEIPKAAFSCTAKCRYSAKDSKCRVEMLDETTAVLEFSVPQRAPSYGQSAVFYDGDRLLGGGIISRE